MDEIFASQHGYYLEDLALGMTALFAKTMTDADVLAFAGLSGDHNPLHVNEEFAAKTRFKRRIVHGMLTTSLWSNPGRHAPARPGCRLYGPGHTLSETGTRWRYRHRAHDDRGHR